MAPVPVLGARRQKKSSNNLPAGGATSAEENPATQPVAAGETPANQPADASVGLTEPYTINPHSIVLLVHQLSPKVRANREKMVSAQHALREFKVNLSRFEPFVKMNTDVSEFPERDSARTTSSEVTGGMEKETYEGAIFRVESGFSASRTRYGDLEGEDALDDGSGALLRARVEVPFVGSRKRQNRVIQQAYQESTARNAELSYVRSFQTYAVTALNYYHALVMYLDYIRLYDAKVEELDKLMADPRVLPEDLARIEPAKVNAEVTRSSYETSYGEYELLLMESLGVTLGAEYAVEEEPIKPSSFVAISETPAGLDKMVQEAYDNNPTFSVYDNAIKDAEIQRDQAIQGRYDITAYLEGTQYPYASEETYDNRVDGWEIGGGVTVRLNDDRVLTASRLKAEAEIRRYQALIESERAKIHRLVLTKTDSLRDKERMHQQLVDLIETRWKVYQDRLVRYLEGKDKTLNVEDVLSAMTQWTSALASQASNRYYRGIATSSLMGSTGEVYRIAGIKVSAEDDQNRGRDKSTGSTKLSRADARSDHLPMAGIEPVQTGGR